MNSARSSSPFSSSQSAYTRRRSSSYGSAQIAASSDSSWLIAWPCALGAADPTPPPPSYGGLGPRGKRRRGGSALLPAFAGQPLDRPGDPPRPRLGLLRLLDRLDVLAAVRRRQLRERRLCRRHFVQRRLQVRRHHHLGRRR